MKKYLITGVLALIVGGFLTSCHDDDGIYGSLVEQKLQTYEQVFKQEFGEINPNQNWGFGGTDNGNTSTSRTRAYTPQNNTYTLTDQPANFPNAPEQPTFRDKSTITEPTIPTSYYNTQAEVTTAGLGFAKDVTSDGATSYVNSSNTGITDKKNQIIYVVGNVTVTSSPGTGSIFVVTRDSKLTISGFGQYVSVYLAPKAKLDVSNATSEVTIDGGNLYMNSQSEVKAASLRFFNGCKVKNAGGTITATNLCVDDKYSTLWNEGTITVTNELKGMNENAYIYNAAGKTITAKDISLINNYDFLYNDGTINASGDIVLTNTSAEIVNNNKLTAASVDMSAGGNMYNTTNGVVTIYGTTFVTNNNTTGTQWMNDGDYTSGDFIVKNINKVYNNCKLTITRNNKGGTGTFTFGGGEHCSFVLNGNASVRTDKMAWGNNSDFYMNNNSMLEVLGECKSYNPNKNHGLHGLGTGYSIFKAASVTYNEKAQNCMNYYGNVWVDTDNHFQQEFLDKDKLETSDQPTYYFKTTNRTVKFKFFGDDCPITEPISGKCHHGYSPNGGDPDTQTIDIITPRDGSKTTTKITYVDKIQFKQSGRVFCEDLGVVDGSDIDFNDIVFDAYIYDKTPVTRTTIIEDGVVKSVTEESNGETTQFAEIYLLAAGGTLEVSVANINVKNSFGVGKTTMVNTIDETVNEDGTVKDYNNNYVIGGADAVYLGRHNYSRIIDIPIFVTYNTLDQKNVLELTAYQGAAPHKICVPIGTRWPYERIVINKAYKNFNSYVKGEGRLGEVTGPVGKNQNYSVDESNNTYYWNNNIEETNLYRDVPYDAPYTGNDPFYENEVDGGSNTVNNKEGGYDNDNMPILIRRRH